MEKSNPRNISIHSHHDGLRTVLSLLRWWQLDSSHIEDFKTWQNKFIQLSVIDLAVVANVFLYKLHEKINMNQEIHSYTTNIFKKYHVDKFVGLWESKILSTLTFYIATKQGNISDRIMRDPHHRPSFVYIAQRSPNMHLIIAARNVSWHV